MSEPDRPGPEAAYDDWSRRHGGLDPRPSWWTAGFVRLTDAVARPLAARGVGPDTVTLAGVVVVATAPALAALGAAWPLVAVLPVVAGALLDGVDGAVASRRGGGTAWGRVLDPLADRVSDLLLLLLLAVVGAPVWVVVALALLTLLHEGVRSSAQVAGMRGPGAVTVWERPSRVIVAGFASGLTGLAWLVGVRADWLAPAWAYAALALALLGLLQLLLAVRRALR